MCSKYLCGQDNNFFVVYKLSGVKLMDHKIQKQRP